VPRYPNSQRKAVIIRGVDAVADWFRFILYEGHMNWVMVLDRDYKLTVETPEPLHCSMADQFHRKFKVSNPVMSIVMSNEQEVVSATEQASLDQE